MGQIKFVCSLNLARGCQFTSPEVRTLKRKCFENFKNCSRNRQSPFRVKIFFWTLVFWKPVFLEMKSWNLNRDVSEPEHFIPLAGWINEKPRCTRQAKPQNSCHTHGPLLRSFHPQTLAEGNSSFLWIGGYVWYHVTPLPTGSSWLSQERASDLRAVTL